MRDAPAVRLAPDPERFVVGLLAEAEQELAAALAQFRERPDLDNYAQWAVARAAVQDARALLPLVRADRRPARRRA